MRVQYGRITGSHATFATSLPSGSALRIRDVWSDEKGKMKTYSHVATAENDGTGKTKKRAATKVYH